MMTSTKSNVVMMIFAIVALSFVHCDDVTGVPVENANTEKEFESYDANLRFLQDCTTPSTAGCIGCCGNDAPKPQGIDCTGMDFYPCYCGAGMKCLNVCEPCS
jgi:hypothetical protein